ncbi:hypothetical protein KW790_02830 [Candidatus Parcubacteria bacterium]|nr:hypothetical protein [Candidatus Parcubacteria bacterium]
MPPKKEEEKKAPDYFPEVIVFLLGLGIIIAAWMRLHYLSNSGAVVTAISWWHAFKYFFITRLWPLFKSLGYLVIGASIVFIIYVWRKLSVIIKEEKEIYGAEHQTTQGEEKILKNEKWERVLTHINSPNASDWRLAIIEADVMLEELLRAQGYHGDSLGEMLKAVEASDFLSLEQAWEAHKIRNQIAHTGGDYELNERDAKRVIAMYEAVFKEFKIV